jgi:hypothetical protein
MAKNKIKWRGCFDQKVKLEGLYKMISYQTYVIFLLNFAVPLVEEDSGMKPRERERKGFFFSFHE